jgi:hypothetical protein
MSKNTPRKLTPLSVQLLEEHRKKLNRLIGYAMMNNVTPSVGRVIRTLIENAVEGPEFLKAVGAVDERERESYREKRRKP